eukprot:scaffold87721_cov48-Prasinocladus_malaysianus.AAC.3
MLHTRAAARSDPECVMAFLGIAIAAGPNVNYAFVQSSSMLRVIHEALQKAAWLLDQNSGNKRVEKAISLFDALLDSWTCSFSPLHPTSTHLTASHLILSHLIL